MYQKCKSYKNYSQTNIKIERRLGQVMSKKIFFSNNIPSKRIWKNKKLSKIGQKHKNLISVFV